jgi:hypothetical protein
LEKNKKYHNLTCRKIFPNQSYICQNFLGKTKKYHTRNNLSEKISKSKQSLPKFLGKTTKYSEKFPTLPKFPGKISYSKQLVGKFFQIKVTSAKISWKKLKKYHTRNNLSEKISKAKLHFSQGI